MSATIPGNQIAEELRDAFTRNRITQSEVAEAVGSSRSAVSRRLSGDTPLTIEEAARYAAVAGLELSVALSRRIP